MNLQRCTIDTLRIYYVANCFVNTLYIWSSSYNARRLFDLVQWYFIFNGHKNSVVEASYFYCVTVF